MNGTVFTLWLGDAMNRAARPFIPAVSLTRESDGKMYIRFDGGIKRLEELTNRWYRLRVKFNPITKTASLWLDYRLLFSRLPLSASTSFTPAISMAAGPAAANGILIDDIDVRVLGSDYIPAPFNRLFNDNFEMDLQNSGWSHSGTGNLDKAYTLKLKRMNGEEVLTVKRFNLPSNYPFDVSDKPFEIKYNNDMENGATHYIPTTSEPDRGPYAASSFSTPAPSTLSTGSTQRSSSKSTGMIDTYYLYSHDGKLMAEYDHNGNAVKYYLYMGSRLIAEYQPDTNKYYYYMSDQINSTRIVTDENGDVVYSEAYGPYGDVQKTWTKTYEPKLKFSGKEREVYSDLDYFGARYYDSNRYRFISVDPIINKEEALTNPQMWNLYTYSRNNPITYFDPDGRISESMGRHEYTVAEHLGKASNDPVTRMFAKEVAISAITAGIAGVAVRWSGRGIRWIQKARKARKLVKNSKFVRDGRSLVSWMKNIEKSGKTLTKAQADKIVKQAKKYGVKIRLDRGHLDTKWTGPHLNIGKKGNIHVKVPKDYVLPD
jgi:RHS repeat-associated protein